MGKFLALVLLSASLSNVEGHGGFAYPFNWVDVGKIGDDMKRFGQNGCVVDPKDGMLWDGKPLDSIANHPDKMNYTDTSKLIRRMSRPNCYYLVMP